MILETGRVERRQKPVQQIRKVYSAFSFQEFRGIGVLGMYHIRKKII